MIRNMRNTAVSRARSCAVVNPGQQKWVTLLNYQMNTQTAPALVPRITTQDKKTSFDQNRMGGVKAWCKWYLTFDPKLPTPRGGTSYLYTCYSSSRPLKCSTICVIFLETSGQHTAAAHLTLGLHLGR